MTLNMNDSPMVSIAQIKEFIKVVKDISFQGASRKEKYAWIAEIINRFKYFTLRKKEKSILKTYMIKMTGLSDAQLTRLIAKKKKTGVIVAHSTTRHRFSTRYTVQDVALLADTDNAHGHLAGPATKKIFMREYTMFKKKEFIRLHNISVAHLYNLRGRRQYLTAARFFEKTKPTTVPIGIRRKPDPQGKPGYLRVDTVHQGDLDKEKGVYHINIVDAVTQWEVVGAVEKISESYLAPLLEELLEQFPFRVIEFHSDNGSEYINSTVAKLLNKLLIAQTKSRARHCNDNALAEGKNGSIVRKHMGYAHIPQRYARPINQFYRHRFNEYLNYHRPCGFATTIVDEKGKERKIYRTYETPFERLRSLKDAAQYLKQGLTWETLAMIAMKQSDNECASLMQKEKVEVFSAIGRSASGGKTIHRALQNSAVSP